MRATIPFLQTKFSEFNSLIFANRLPNVPIHISRARRSMGLMKYRIVRNGLSVTHTDHSIWISNCMDLPQNVLEDILIHEMIHLYISVHSIPDDSVHGHEFIRMMREINHRFGRNISVSHRTDEQQVQSDNLLRWHYICVTTFTDGSRACTACARSRIFLIHRLLQKQSDVASWQWYVSTDQRFNILPRSQSLKYYRISPELEQSIAQARPCSCDGETFRLANS